MNLYEIELEGGNCHDGGPFYSTTIVACADYAPAGTAPAAVVRHARLLRDIAGGNVTYTVCHYRPTVVSANHISRGAEAIGPLTERTTNL